MNFDKSAPTKKSHKNLNLAITAVIVGQIVAILGTHRFVQIGLDADANHVAPQASPTLVIFMLSGFVVANIALSFIFRTSAKLITSGKDKKRSLYLVSWGAILSLVSFITYLAAPISLALAITGMIRSQNITDAHLKTSTRVLGYVTIAALVVGLISSFSVR